MQVGSSAPLRIGQSVFAIGNVGHQSRTLSAGVVSGLKRAIPSPVGQKIPGAIQVHRCVSDAICTYIVQGVYSRSPGTLALAGRRPLLRCSGCSMQGRKYFLAFLYLSIESLAHLPYEWNACTQTDASIDQSMSGGPLLDSTGRLVGMCLAPQTASVRPPVPLTSLRLNMDPSECGMSQAF